MTYLLIGAFMFIWVIAGFRVYKALHKDEEIYGEASNAASRLDDSKMDSFALMLNYPDPFEIRQDRIASQTQPVQPVSSVATQNREASKLPAVAYKPSGIVLKGIISNNTGKRKVALISVQGKEISLKEKETVGILTLLKVFNDDSVRIDYDGHQINLLR